MRLLFLLLQTYRHQGQNGRTTKKTKITPTFTKCNLIVKIIIKKAFDKKIK